MNRENGVSVLLTSHDLDDIEQICDNALVISKGKNFYHGALSELKEKYATTRLITVKGPATEDIAAIAPDVKAERDGQTTKLIFDIKKYTSNAMMEVVSRCFDIQDITIEEPGIDHVVSRIFTAGAAS
jgi:ABC-2 type transport system ATP-binding protein